MSTSFFFPNRFQELSALSIHTLKDYWIDLANDGYAYYQFDEHDTAFRYMGDAREVALMQFTKLEWDTNGIEIRTYCFYSSSFVTY